MLPRTLQRAEDDPRRHVGWAEHSRASAQCSTQLHRPCSGRYHPRVVSIGALECSSCLCGSELTTALVRDLPSLTLRHAHFAFWAM